MGGAGFPPCWLFCLRQLVWAFLYWEVGLTVEDEAAWMKPPPVSPKVTQAEKVKPRLETVFLWGRRAVSGRRASFLIQLPTA